MGISFPPTPPESGVGPSYDPRQKQEKLEAKVKQLLEEQVETDNREARASKKQSSSGKAHRREQIRRLQRSKVNIQWLLYYMVHNIEKIANYGYA